MTKQKDEATRRRLTIAFGWIAGASLGLVLNGVTFSFWGRGYPVVPTTFVLFVAGAFGGMKVADHYGHRAFTPLGIAAGVLLAFALATLFMVIGAVEEPY